MFLADPKKLPKVKAVHLNLLEFQTIIFMLSDLSIVDPFLSNLNNFSSIPFSGLTTFEDICKIVLFKYIKVDKYSSENDNSERSETP